MLLPHGSSGPFSAGLPATLEPGQQKTFYFPYSADSFLKDSWTGIGVADTYGRHHWCRRSAVTRARERYQKDFIEKKGGGPALD
jgi:hypothetical protein